MVLAYGRLLIHGIAGNVFAVWLGDGCSLSRSEKTWTSSWLGHGNHGRHPHGCSDRTDEIGMDATVSVAAGIPKPKIPNTAHKTLNTKCKTL